MVEPRKVNLIWAAVELGMIRVHDGGERIMKTSAIVDEIVGVAQRALCADESITREDILEAWLYRELHHRMATAGIDPVRRPG